MARPGLTLGFCACAAAAPLMLAAAALSIVLSVLISTPAGDYDLEGGALMIGSPLGPPWDVALMDGVPIKQWPLLPQLERWSFSTPYANSRGVRLVLPLWMPFAATAVMGLFLWRRRRRALWMDAGRCGACGYDLRGTPARVLCPECGTPPPALTPVPEPANRES
jgi:hypothetical protein